MECQRHAFDFPEEDDYPSKSARLAYLNTAYLGPLPRRSRDAAKSACERQTQPFVHLAGKPGTQLSSFYSDVEQCRAAFAALVTGSTADDIALVPSTSYAMSVARKNLLPIGLLDSNSRILVLEQQFQSNLYCWEDAVQEAGGELLVVARPDDFDWTRAVLEEIDGAAEGTLKLVALPCCHWTDGSTLDLVSIGARCRAVGARFVIDGTQSIGAVPFDVSAVKPDFLAVSAYKWLLCPYGLAFLYAAPEHQAHGQPIEQHNWERTGEGFYQYDYTQGARRFDGGQRSNVSLRV